MSKKILVAGGAGMIGSFICEKLVKKGHKVTVIDSLITGLKKNISHLIDNKSIEFIEGDIREPLKLSQKFDQIYNLASPASPIDFDRIPLYILETGSKGHENLLKLATEWKARILYASTSEVYGDPKEHPQKEEYFGNCSSIGPRSCYDEAKRYGEALTMAFHRSQRTDTRIARIFNTYGPRMRLDDGRIIPNFFVQCLKNEPITIHGDGMQTRSYCFVEDEAEGLISLMESNYINPVNVGNPIEFTVIDVAKKIKTVTNSNSELIFEPGRENDPKVRCPDITKAKELLNWDPSTPFDEGLKHCKNFFESEVC